MTIALVDDQLLSAILRGKTPRSLSRPDIFTTGCWYVRLCQAALGGTQGPGVLSLPFASLPDPLRTRALAAVLELPPSIGLLSLRELAPEIGELRRSHDLNLLSVEALAAAVHLGATVHLSASSPRLEAALEARSIRVRLHV